MWCNLTGHSMEPEISNGDVIALKEVKSPIEYLPAGEIYGIITDDYRTVKRIRPGVQKDLYVLFRQISLLNSVNKKFQSR